MIDSRSLYRKLSVRALVEDSLQLPEIFGGYVSLHGERSYSSRDGSDHASNLSPCKSSPRQYIHVYMKALMVEMNRLTYIIHVTVVVKLNYLSSRMMRLFAVNCVQFVVLHIQYCQELLLTTLPY